jgi:citrate/tricarballylate utilization protein
MHATENLAEADRVMTVCNSCRYCEGLCAVFPAMEMRRVFADADLNYLANLCHACGACYIDCQFAPPHEFNVNVPRVLAEVRAGSYAHYAWPRVLRGLFARNGLAAGAAAAASVAAFVLAFLVLAGPQDFFAARLGPAAFYALMPHKTMAVLFGAVFIYALIALAMGLRNFSRDTEAPRSRPRSLWRAVLDAGRLRYLDGGGTGCYKTDGRTDRRRIFHHLTFYGFLLCFASTSIATVYHYLLGLEAPYAWYDLPVLLGFSGGLGLAAGPAGLLFDKYTRDPAPLSRATRSMDVAFLVSLMLTSLTGLALLFLRATSLMNLALAIHLGFVFALFITLPYGKFVHGLYRFLALTRYAQETETVRSANPAEAGTK